VNQALINNIDSARRSLDIAFFAVNNPGFVEAVLQAQQRGVRVRIVTDDENGIEEGGMALIEAGIPVVDDGRSALMHDDFMIIDGDQVWAGNAGLTVNSTTRNNTNSVRFTSAVLAEIYTKKFDEMFTERRFGPAASTSTSNFFTQQDVPIQVYFSPTEDIFQVLANTLNTATRSIDFMVFSFTLDDIGNIMLERAADQVSLRGIFETTGSSTSFSELPPLFCAGMDVRVDGNPFAMNHKVIIIDAQTVIVGSTNLSDNAISSNDENLLIISDADLAAQYLAEFERLWAVARPPDDISCDT
jgi:phosphatidylserine/phosphatidylglycerophosphate/cardiolipin synthase-like enzyme